jgi:hypothetical protein
MGILDNLAPKQKLSVCRVELVSLTLDPKDAKILLNAALDPNWGYQPLSVALAERGISLSDKAIKKHRTKLCSCDKVK